MMCGHIILIGVGHHSRHLGPGHGEPPTEYSPMYAGHVRRSLSTTVNVDIIMQCIFSRILRRALAASNFDMSENYKHTIIE